MKRSFELGGKIRVNLDYLKSIQYYNLSLKFVIKLNKDKFLLLEYSNFYGKFILNILEKIWI